MPSPLYRSRIEKLRAAGFELLRQGKGSHEIWRRAQDGVTLVVLQLVKKPTTANAILKTSRLAESILTRSSNRRLTAPAVRPKLRQIP
jgi:predicted RNA binding protein YcfA (HicA-like mRNA interferase family)